MTTPQTEPCCKAQAERDQYAAAARHLALRIREVACTWSRTLPEMVRTADVVSVLLGISSHVPDRPELRDDLWMRIAGAYEARFANDGHPEDARHAADEAMSVVQPVLAELRADRDQLTKKVERLDAMAAAWAKRLPDTIRTATAVEAIHQVTREGKQ